jgi:hypothetical protein
MVRARGRPEVDQSPEHEDDEAVDRALDLMDRPDRGAPLVKRMNGVNVINFSDVLPLYSGLPPQRKLLLLLLLLALKDKASEVRFEPSVTEPEGYGLRLFYEVDRQLHELAPPPQHLAQKITREIKAVAGFYSMRRRLADGIRRLANMLDAQTEHSSQSTFQMVGGDDKIDISALVYSSEMGDRVFLRFSDCPGSLSERAQHAMREIFDQSKPSDRSNQSEQQSLEL